MRTIENAADIIIKNRWFICQCIFLVYIAALAVMDFKYRKLPLKTLLSGLFIAAAGCLCGREISPVLLATGGCMGIVFLLISRVSGESFGYGDSILILIIGIFLGFWNLMYLLLGAFSMAAVFSAVMMIKHRFNRKSSFPFVPFLAAAYLGGMFIGTY
ncbi:prepilin peptidase [Lachnoclostridium sp. An76]|jgi:leader peptidase (prepilin peptidase)/N-methyltransferase|uniref:prepilin peptidase n=1 Tax=Lachnoclostridium sp. An76 TaxID=1965654 RepID=UPI000B36ECE1|nr:prepilin peptidase [Lachnoclostridium sp. An76]OUN34706.1 hypothetical protein B5G27_08260 [Lachnoclostridium sp. An76]